MNDYNGPEDEHLRRLLNDAVGDVEPRGSLDSIRARTVSTPLRRRPWVLGAGAAAVATAATVAAVAVMGGNPGTTGAADPGFAGGSPTVAGTGEASGLPDPEPSTTPPTTAEPSQPGMSTDESSASSPQSLTVPVYYPGETNHGLRLFREFHTVQGEDSQRARIALNEAVSVAPSDADYRTDWPAGTTVEGVSFDGAGNDGIATVHVKNPTTGLHDRPPGMTEEAAALAIEQLVYTVQAATQTRAPVQFMLDGGRTDTLLGVPVSEPVTQGDATAVLALVWIISPAEGAEVTAPFEVSGLANAFEANVQWELMQGETVVKDGFTTAEEAFTMAPYSFTVKDVPPGEYTLVVHDEDASGGAEGPGPSMDTKNLTVK
jgi:hypothetical protein